MNKYCFLLKPLEKSSRYEKDQIEVIVNDMNVYYARKNVEFEYPEYRIVKVIKNGK